MIGVFTGAGLRITESPAAAEDSRTTCETLVSHTPLGTVAKFVTDQVPEPRAALGLACVLQLTDTDEGARFWWQYAAGAGQAAAAYCLYLHHLALGEGDTADFWHRQTDDVQPPPQPSAFDDGGTWHPAEHRITSTTTTHFMRVLGHLAKQNVRSRPAGISKLTAYIPTAVTAGYLREPDTELPLPGHETAPPPVRSHPRTPERSTVSTGRRTPSRWAPRNAEHYKGHLG